MLEQLFGSRTRTRLLRLFLKNPDQKFFIRELTRRIDTQINSVRRELKNLASCGIIDEVLDKTISHPTPTPSPRKGRKLGRTESALRKYFKANPSFLLFGELSELVLKSPLLLQNRFVRDISNFGTVDFVLMSGFFVGRTDTPVDLLIVGEIDRHKLSRFITHLQKEIDQEINYALMKVSEYLYRKSITDRFLFTLLEGKKIILIDRLPVRERV